MCGSNQYDAEKHSKVENFENLRMGEREDKNTAKFR